jgi:2,3,4,5-tetrahydropyridine-2-carboxylate N-succinyltransferase
MQELIDAAWQDRDLLQKLETRTAVREVISRLDNGRLRVAEKTPEGWVVHGWVKKAILLFFSVAEMDTIELGPYEYYDKIPLKKNWKEAGVRVVPPGCARYGSFLERGCVLMPGYVNIGARVGEGTMIDTWATVGSCAQIGRNVHLSGGVGIGGVLEPPSAAPVIVEDGCFIGSRAVVVEGVVVEQEAVLGANVVVTASTQIVDVTTSPATVYRGRVPARSVVIPGTVMKEYPGGQFGVPAALIIGQRKESTDRKTSLNEVLREFALAV